MTANRSPLEVALGGSVLAAVPAVHFRLAFAEEVNRTCANPMRRPDAIAVELGPATAAAVRHWLGELGVGPARRRRLPILLGLLKPNRYLKPAVRERALELQRRTGIALRDLPPAVLRRELGYSPVGTLLLSPTDSIIEAIRCGCELGVPVYGVDLEEMAEPQYEPVLIADPSGARGRVGDYVADNEAYAQDSDREIDPRREMAMAARLKALLGRHQRVLFTCGMAHWRRIRESLRDSALRPALIPEPPAEEAPFASFERVAVDPRIGAAYLDPLPVIARLYERQRAHPLLGPSTGARGLPDPQAIHGQLLRRVYRRYFARDGATDWGPRKRQDWSATPAFEHLMATQSRVSMRTLPALSDIYACARATMSRAFCQALTQSLMGMRWAEAGEHGATAGLAPAGSAKSGGLAVRQHGGRHDGRIFPLNLLPGQAVRDDDNGSLLFDAPRPRSAMRDRQSSLLTYVSRHTWVPWDNLVTGLSAVAFGYSGKGERVPISEEFGGQLLDGIDVKGTLRAQARGDRRLFVRSSRRARVAASGDPTERFPVVWLFDADPDAGDCEFEHYTEQLSDTLRYARDPEVFRRVVQEKGNSAVAVIAFGERNFRDPMTEVEAANLLRVDLRGAAFFMPLFPGHRQFARWFERTKFARNPFSDLLDLPEEPLKECDASAEAPAEPLRWQDQLVQAALPFARESITVVAPGSFRLAPTLFEQAATRRVAIWTVPLERFPAQQVARLRCNYMVPGTMDDATDSIVYTREAEELLDEPLDRYLDLVPARWRTFGLD